MINVTYISTAEKQSFQLYCFIYISDKSKERQAMVTILGCVYLGKMALNGPWWLPDSLFHKLFFADLPDSCGANCTLLYFYACLPANSHVITDMLSWLLLFKPGRPVRVDTQWFSEIQKFVEVECEYKLVRHCFGRCVLGFNSLFVFHNWYDHFLASDISILLISVRPVI